MAASLGALKDRIVRETNRDDLTDVTPSDATAASRATLDLVIQGAIDDYADTRFTFNEAYNVTTTLVVGQNVTPLPTIPAFMRRVDRLSMNYGGAGSSRYDLRRVELEEWDRITGYVASNGQPNVYAIVGTTALVWPTPNFAYPLTWVGVVDIAYPTTDVGTNAWITQADDLIAAQARFRLMRDYFRDTDGANLANAAATDALNKLSNRMARRTGTRRLRAQW